MRALDPSTITSVAMSPLRCTPVAPSGILCPGSVMTVTLIPRETAWSTFLPRLSRISEKVGVDTMNVSVALSRSSPIFSKTRGFDVIVYTSWGSPFFLRTSWRRSSFAKVSSRWSMTRSFTLLGDSGLKIVGRPRVEIAKPLLQRLWRTL